MAAAQPDAPEVLRLSYEPKPGCPPREELLAELRARTSRFRLAGEAESARTVVVEVRTADGEHVGRLALRSADGHEAAREVRGATCSEVVSAVVLIAAVAIDPSVAPPLPPPPPDQQPARWVSREPGSVSRPARVELTVGAHVGLLAGALPNLALVGRVHVEGALLRGAWSPALRLSIAGALPQRYETAEGTADLAFVAARLDACPLRWPAQAWARLVPCAAFEGGAHDGKGTSTRDPRSATRGWIAPGVLVRAEARPAGPLVLELEAGVEMALLRYRFYFVPDAVAYETPPAAAWAAVGIGLRFP